MLHGGWSDWQYWRAMDAHSINPPKLILAIDDEPEILNVIKECLEMEGFQVLAALGAKAGLKLYEERWTEIGVVLLDFLMPDMTGDLVFECLRQKNPDVRVILLTGCEDSVARKMFETGLRGLIQKPFYIDDLVNRIREEISQG
jgi:two-component system cell cycle sensor histidine kinase/response regulator CckA